MEFANSPGGMWLFSWTSFHANKLQSMWTHLKAYITIAIEKEKAKQRPGALYVAVSVRSMQAVDFTWLAETGFSFHHYRAPGHGVTPLAKANEVVNEFVRLYEKNPSKVEGWSSTTEF